MIRYSLGASYYIFLFGVSIGSKASNIWLIQSLIALIEDIILLQPLKIYIKWILLASAVSSIQVWHQLLCNRSINIMKRKTGLIYDSSALIQRFNPSCRVARQCPHLSSSRLLMSLNDFDLPIHYILESKSKYTITTILIIITAIIISTLPEFLRNASIDSLIRPNLNGFFLCIIYLTHISIGIPIAIGIGLILLIILYSYYKNNYKSKQTNIVTPLISNEMKMKMKMSIKTKLEEKKSNENNERMNELPNLIRMNIKNIKEKQRKFNSVFPNENE